MVKDKTLSQNVILGPFSKEDGRSETSFEILSKQSKKRSSMLDDLVAHAALIPGRTESELREDLREQGIDPDHLLGKLDAMLQAARAQTCQKRVATVASTRRDTALLATSLTASLVIFYAAGGIRRGARPESLVAATTVGAAIIALAALWGSVVRSRSMPARSHRWLITVALSIPAILMGWKILWSAHFPRMMNWWTNRYGLKCLGLSLALSACPLVAFAWSRRATDPPHPRALGAAAGISIGAGSWVLVDLWCPFGHPAHLMIGHLLPLTLVGLAGLWVGDRLLALRSSAPPRPFGIS